MTITRMKNFNACYEVTLADGTVLIVPQDPQNADYVRAQAWLAAGGTLTS